MQKIVSLCLVLLAVGVLALSASAQDGLTQDQLALVERVHNARIIQDQYHSYREEAIVTHLFEIAIVQGNRTVSRSTDSTLARTGTVVRTADQGNILAEIILSVEQTGPQGAQAYRVLAEARLVDDILYVQAHYEDPAAQLPALPDGWIELEDPDEQANPLAQLELTDLLDRPLWIDDLDLMLESVVDASVEPGELDDGTPIDIITLTVDEAGIRRLWDEPDITDIEPALAAVLGPYLLPESDLVVMLWIDADEHISRIDITMQAQAAEVPGTQFDPDLSAGSLMDVTITTTRTETYTDINQPLPATTAPDLDG